MLDERPDENRHKILAAWNGQWKSFYSPKLIGLGMIPHGIARTLQFEEVRKNDAGFTLWFGDVPRLLLNDLTLVVPSQSYGDYFFSGRRVLERYEVDSLRVAGKHPELKAVVALLTGLLGSNANIKNITSVMENVYSGEDAETGAQFQFRVDLEGSQPNYIFTIILREEPTIRISEPDLQVTDHQPTYGDAVSLFYRLVPEFRELRRARNYFDDAKKGDARLDIASQRMVHDLEIENCVWSLSVTYSQVPDSRPSLFTFARDFSLKDEFAGLTITEIFLKLWKLFLHRDFAAVSAECQPELNVQEEGFITATFQIDKRVFVSMSLEQREDDNYRAEVTFALKDKQPSNLE